MTMRVAVDCRAATARMSGVGRYVVNLLRGLAEAGGFELLALVGEDAHPELGALPGVDLVATGWTARRADPRARLVWEQRDLARLLATLKPDLFHATWNHGIPWTCPCPAILTLHDLLPLQMAGQFGDRSQRLAFLASQYLALWRARRILAVSGATRDAVRRFARPVWGRTEVVHEGVEARFAPDPDAGPPAHILYVGGREPRKNIASLLDGYRRAAAPLPLRLTGSAESLGAADAAALAALPAPVRGRIAFLGAVPDDAMPDLYRRAAMLLFPSRGEGFGFPPLEAMACGTPVVTTRAGSIPEIAGEAAVYVDPDDADAIAGAIRALLADDALRARLAAAGLRRAAAMTWPRCVAATRAAYRDVLGAR
jgi:glycosyltransferase involved in cell wall biosynthesis